MDGASFSTLLANWGSPLILILTSGGFFYQRISFSHGNFNSLGDGKQSVFPVLEMEGRISLEGGRV